MADKIIKWNNKLLTWNKKYIRTYIQPQALPEYPTDHLVERWDFNSSLVGLNGKTFSKTEGTTTYDSFGSYGSLVFDGATVYSTADSSIYGTINAKNQFSFSAWLYGSWTSGISMVFTGNVGGEGVTTFTYMGMGSQKLWYGREKEAVASVDAYTSSNFWTTPATYKHWVGTFDGSVFQNYVNGSSDGSPSAAGIDLYPDDTTEFFLGYGIRAGGRYFTGNVALLYLYDKVLTGTEITTLYNGGYGA